MNITEITFDKDKKYFAAGLATLTATTLEEVALGNNDCIIPIMAEVSYIPEDDEYEYSIMVLNEKFEKIVTDAIEKSNASDDKKIVATMMAGLNYFETYLESIEYLKDELNKGILEVIREKDKRITEVNEFYDKQMDFIYDTISTLTEEKIAIKSNLNL